MRSYQATDARLIVALSVFGTVAWGHRRPEPNHRAQLTIPAMSVPVPQDAVRQRTDFSLR